MDYIPQHHLQTLERFLTPQKALIVFGPRRVGKTTLLKKFLESVPDEQYLFVDGDDILIRDAFSNSSIEKLQTFVGDRRLLVIDETQSIPNIGISLKLLLDHVDGMKVIASGSSSFDLAHKTGEPLTGRKYTFTLYPPAQMELASIEAHYETAGRLEERLVFGSYPEIITTRDKDRRIMQLSEIVGSYLLKDVLAMDGIRHSDKLLKLLQCLAFQIGKEVSYTELGTQLSMSKNTVDKYLDLLEKAFVIYKMPGFSRNLRKEVSKNPRFYFFDTGVRNALIHNFNPLSLRDDLGMLWENYVVTERRKRLDYTVMPAALYFWRTYDKKEIDLVEERDGRLFGYEIKWQAKKVKPPNDWISTYQNASFQQINRENYLDFIVPTQTQT